MSSHAWKLPATGAVPAQEHSTGKDITRRALLRTGVLGAAMGTATLTMPVLARAASAPGVSHGSEQIGEIYELQAAFHRAKSHQDIDLMVSLWAEDCTFTVNGTVVVLEDELRDRSSLGRHHLLPIGRLVPLPVGRCHSRVSTAV